MLKSSGTALKHGGKTMNETITITEQSIICGLLLGKKIKNEPANACILLSSISLVGFLHPQTDKCTSVEVPLAFASIQFLLFLHSSRKLPIY